MLKLLLVIINGQCPALNSSNLEIKIWLEFLLAAIANAAWWQEIAAAPAATLVK